jgi:hypothetical protein
MVISRRYWLAAGAARAFAAPSPGVTRDVFLASPKPGTAIISCAWYTRKSGGEMTSIEQRWSRSDTIDVSYYRHSRDHGHTWSAPVEHATGEKRPEGMLRRHPRAAWVDPRNGRLVEFWVEGVLPSDDPLEGMRQWNIYYTVDGGPAQQVIHRGAEFGPRHPLPGVWTGKNSVMIGDMPCRPLAVGRHQILLPGGTTPLTEDGKLYNPTGAYTYHDAAILIATWHGKKLEWEMGDPIQADPVRATRGMDEPTLAQLADGRLLVVMRGSNDKRPELPSYRWHSFSSDGGRHWTKPAPWTYTNGEPFFSPSACSQLLAHSNGKLYWLGNITPENPKGNRPRYPFVMGEVDLRTGLLKRESIRVIDDKGPDDDPLLTLSNFFAREDRESGGIALHMTRLVAAPTGWRGDALLYRIGLIN